MSKRIGVILSGCGFKDGAEIHESVSALLALDRTGAQVVCMAPDVPFTVTDHRTSEPTEETRNVLTESARIARGEIQSLADIQVGDLDGLVLPGGFGAATHLSDFATKGPDATVHPAVARLVVDMLKAGKPVGAICIAPATLAAIGKLVGKTLTLTVGGQVEAHQGVIDGITALGQTHQACAVTEACIDESNKVATTPAYMYGARISEVYTGIETVINQIVAWA